MFPISIVYSFAQFHIPSIIRALSMRKLSDAYLVFLLKVKPEILALYFQLVVLYSDSTQNIE